MHVPRLNLLLTICVSIIGLFSAIDTASAARKTHTVRFQFKTGIIGNAEVVLHPTSSEADFTLYRGYIKSRRARSTPQKVTAVEIKNTSPSKFIINVLLPSNTSQRSLELSVSGSKAVRIKSAPQQALESKTCADIETAASTISPTAAKTSSAATSYKTSAATIKYTATISVDCDAGCAEFLGPTEARAKIAEFVNTVSSIYETQFGISLVLKNTLIRTATSVYPTNISDASQLLNLFRTKAGDLGQATVRHLLTSFRDVSDNIAGLSYVGSVCADPSFAVGWTKNFNTLFTPYIMAHEIGHTFGAEHDPNSQGIMAAVLQLPVATTFSNFSANQITKNLNSLGSLFCLTPEGAAGTSGVSGTGSDSPSVSSNDTSPAVTAQAKLTAGSFSIKLATKNQPGASCSVVANVGRNAGEARRSPIIVLSGATTASKKSFTFATRDAKLLKALPKGKATISVKATCDGFDSSLSSSATVQFAGSTKNNLKKWLALAGRKLKLK